MTAPYINNHAALALSRLTSQFNNKPNLAAILNAHSAQYQAIEDAFNSIMTLKPFGPSCGTNSLNHWGASVGFPRPKTGLAATDDPTYYRQVLARIIVNSSTGTADTLIALLTALGATSGIYSEPGPATVLVTFGGALLLDDITLRQLVNLATPSVSVVLVTYAAPPFGFAGNPIAAGFNLGQLARDVA